MTSLLLALHSIMTSRKVPRNSPKSGESFLYSQMNIEWLCQHLWLDNRVCSRTSFNDPIYWNRTNFDIIDHIRSWTTHAGSFRYQLKLVSRSVFGHWLRIFILRYDSCIFTGRWTLILGKAWVYKYLDTMRKVNSWIPTACF